VKWSSSCSVSNSLWFHWLEPARLLCSWTSPGKNAGVGRSVSNSLWFHWL